MYFRIKMIVRNCLIQCYMYYLRIILGMDLSTDAKVSLKANLDKTNPKGVHVGSGTYIAFGVTILSHDYCRSIHMDTTIGRNCFIGAYSIILPGVRVGDSVVVGAGSVVTKDIGSNVIVAGNPARIIRENIITSKYGVLLD